jgi:squalene-hopene/tetraprenyl-beta-curcumene cyclase
VRYLERTQLADGTWHEPAFTGTGFPRVFYLKYHLYRVCFPLLALARYQRAAASRSERDGANPGLLACRIPALPLSREV